MPIGVVGAGASVSALTDRLLALSEDARRVALAELSPDDLAALEYCWPVWGRADQQPPLPIRDDATDENRPWRHWLMLAGRGAGKTRSSAEWVRAEVEAGKRRSIGIVSPTADTGRRDCVAALLACSPPWSMPQYEAAQRRLVWPNGAIGYVLSSEEPDRLRGLNLDGFWGDELSSWSNQNDVWSNLQLALRVYGPKGDPPAGVISTTPKPQALIKAIIADPATVTTRASTFANRANLSDETLAFLTRKYAGTTIGRQELEGEIILDAEGALWSRAILDASRVQHAPADMRRLVVAVDPAGGSHKGSAETGIVVAGLGTDAHAYVLQDASCRVSPERWARRAVDLYQTMRADAIVVEVNFGGEMALNTLSSVDPNVKVKKLTASRGKAIRAEPVVALYEQRRVHHVGLFTELEDQLCEWEPASNQPSPDRLDALVWAITELMVGAQPKPAKFIDLNWMAR